MPRDDKGKSHEVVFHPTDFQPSQRGKWDELLGKVYAARPPAEQSVMDNRDGPAFALTGLETSLRDIVIWANRIGYRVDIAVGSYK